MYFTSYDVSLPHKKLNQKFQGGIVKYRREVVESCLNSSTVNSSEERKEIESVKLHL